MLELGNAELVYLPPNSTALIQPMNQTILHSFESKYKFGFLHLMLVACNNTDAGINEFFEELNRNDSM